MSITKKINGDGVENGDGYSCLSMADGEEKIIYGGEKGMKEKKGIFLDSSSCSSIGKNSDEDDDDAEEEDEVQSSYICNNGNGSFDSIQALEEALPMRRGMSRFYNGKSKSFTSLTDASSSPSIKEIAKPENAYSRRRRNLLAFNLLSDKNRSLQPKSNGVSKRSANTGRATLALAVAMTINNPITHDTESNSDSSPNFVSRLSPHHPQFIQSHCTGNFSAWRSFSFADLHHCGSLKSPAPR